MNETITTREQKQRKRIEIPRLAVSKRFGMYKDEEKKTVRDADVKKNATIEALINAWSKFYSVWKCGCLVPYLDYEYAQSLIRGIEYTVRDVHDFSYILAALPKQDHHGSAGQFLSALINNGKESNYLICTEAFGKKIDDIGHMNEKQIIVQGNGGNSAGFRMKSGELIIEGDAEAQIGRMMSGGTIVVKKFADWRIGEEMSGGTIRIEGAYESELWHGIPVTNIGREPKEVGYKMKGGRILISAGVEDYAGSHMEGGELIIKERAGARLGLGMLGGSIHVMGNAGLGIGHNMEGGSITVEGGIGPTGPLFGIGLYERLKSVGDGMKGGEIHINGEWNYNWFIPGDVIHGKIYHKGKLIVDK